MIIALDVMGFENNISHAIKAAKKFVRKNKDTEIILVGNKNLIIPHINDLEFKIVHTTDIVEMDENPLTTMRKTNSSMYQAVKLVADNKADGVLSAGSTASYVTLVYFLIKNIKNIQKPGFMPYLPTTDKKGMVMVDVGANKVCTGEELVKFAKLANFYCKTVREIPQPRIGIINIGTEDNKGFEYHKIANDILSKDKTLNYIGFIEPRNIINGITDIAVCDGYTGNITLKSLEGALKAVNQALKKSYFKPWNWLSLIFSPMIVYSMKKTFDYRNNAGAIVLGTRKPAVKTHGSADWQQFYSSLRILRATIASDFCGKTQKYFEKNDK